MVIARGVFNHEKVSSCKKFNYAGIMFDDVFLFLSLYIYIINYILKKQQNSESYCCFNILYTRVDISLYNCYYIINKNQQGASLSFPFWAHITY